jgi:ElaB/YqjD/DUF883 family membrane-anchored ribosome-binding protein
VDWNPIHWVKDALHDLKGDTLDPIHRWVLKRIAQAGGFIEDDIRKAANFVWSHFHDVGNTISHLAGQINNLLADVGGDATKLWKGARSDVEGWVSDAINTALSIGGVLWNDAKSWAKDANSYADSAVSTFDRDVLAPALSGLHTALKDIEAAPDKVWHDWLNDVWAPADHTLHTAEVDAHSALHWVEHEGHDIKVLLDGCWDWLVYLGKLSVEEAEHLPEQLKARLPSELTVASMAPDKALWDKMVDELRKEVPSA